MTEQTEPLRTNSADAFLMRLNSVHLIIAAIAAQIVPILIALNISQALALVIAAAIVAAAVGVWRLSEHRKRREIERKQHEKAWKDRRLRPGFRGLSSYTRDDELPGETRQKLARRIAAEVAHPAFRYGLISGEVGAGKSSLLDSGAARELEHEGFDIVFVRGLQDTTDRTRESVLSQLRSRLAELEEPILILDQFEEMLIEWKAPEARRALGEFLNKPLEDRIVRVVCSVRSDYIIAMHDLAPGLPDPTSARTLNPIKNLDESEAAEIILACARQDRMNIDKTLAATIAADLAHGGRVRPPELQLVCIALQSESPERVYRERGGAEGILSAHVKDVAESARDPLAARLILRAMCNFEAMPPAKRHPQTVQQLSAALANTVQAANVQPVLNHLRDAGLVRQLGEGDETAYALIHDYLVQSVARATSETATTAERATQLLRLHLTEYSADDRSRIPLRRLRLIQRHADPELLRAAPARSLMSKSFWAAGRRATAIMSAAGILILLISSLPGLIAHWPERGRPAATHHPGGYPVTARSRFAADRKVILTTNVELRRSDPSEYVSLWEVAGPRRLLHARGTAATISQNGATVAYIRIPRDAARFQAAANSASEAVVLQRSSGAAGIEFVPVMTIHATRSSLLELNESGTRLLVREYVEPTDDVETRIMVWDVTTRRLVMALNFEENVFGSLDASGRILSTSVGYDKFELWDVDSRTRVLSLDLGVVETDRSSRRLVHVGEFNGQASLSLWNLDPFRLVATARQTVSGNPVVARFLSQGRYLLVYYMLGNENQTEVRAVLYRLPDFRIIAQLPGETHSAIVVPWSADPINDRAQEERENIVIWRQQGSTYAWTAQRGVHRAPALDIATVAAAEVAPRTAHVAILRENGRIEIWNTDRWIRIAAPALPGPAQSVRFTADGAALFVSLAGGALSLVEVATGRLITTFSDLEGVEVAHYNAECAVVHLWTENGFFYRFARGRNWPFFGFAPLRDCRAGP